VIAANSYACTLIAGALFIFVSGCGGGGSGGRAGGSVHIDVEGPASAWLAAAGDTAEAAGSRLRLPIQSVEQVPDIVSRLSAAGARIVRVTPDRRSLEDVYLDLVGARK